jgi:hypothetical protein
MNTSVAVTRRGQSSGEEIANRISHGNGSVVFRVRIDMQRR